MKKIVSLMLALVMSLVLCVPAFAVDVEEEVINTENSSITISDTASGKLIDESGNVTLVTGYRRDIPMVASDSTSDFVVAYDYVVPITHRHEVSGLDDTAYLQATMILYYDESAYEPNEYLLTKVGGVWSDPVSTDGTKVSETASIVANCTGIGVSTFWKRQVKEGTITSGAYMNTGFTSSIQTHLGAMGATMTIGLSQGTTRHWDLVLECFPIDPTV